jgi:anti-sigma regulatory factor (Ser/Thr protein kinase)
VCDYTAPACLTLPPRPESVGEARSFLRQRFCQEHDAKVVDSAVLLVSELVTNTVRYGRPPVAVQIECDQTHTLQVRVSDASPALPVPGHADPDDESGRGLAIVEFLSDDWGVDPGEGGKTVWFRIATHPTADHPTADHTS